MNRTSAVDNYHAQLQPRDILILRGLFEARVMTIAHVAKLYFESRLAAAKKRVKKLKTAGFIAYRPRKAYEPAILFLTKRAFVALHQGGYLRDYPQLPWTQMLRRARVSQLTLAHELAVMDVKAAICSALADRSQLAAEALLTWPLLYQFKAAPFPGANDVLVKPDGYLRISQVDADGESTQHHFFLELDRSTETLGTLVLRAGCYRDYYRRGGLAGRFGAGQFEPETVPFRVLMVFASKERRNNTAERLLLHRPPILSQVWLTTLPELLKDPVGAIWIRPIDYRDATRHTRFDPSQPRSVFYRTQSDREALIEQNVRRSPLFGSAKEKPSNAQLEFGTTA